MTPILPTLAPGLRETGSRRIDRLVPDPAERESQARAIASRWATGTAGDADESLGDPGPSQLAEPLPQPGTATFL